MSGVVWEFSNKRTLNKKQFLSYIQKKVFKSFRKHGLLPSDKVIRLCDDGSLSFVVLKHIFSSRFEVVVGGSSSFSYDNQSDLAEKIFSSVLQGVFSPSLSFGPLCDVSDVELELYGSLLGLSGSLPSRDPVVQEYFSSFSSKNPDLERNVIRAFFQVP